MEKKTKQTKTLGVALGAGGVRGFAHIGMLDVLQKEGIKISAISGTSMGSMVGAVFALGLSIDDFIAGVVNTTPESFFSLRTLNLRHESLMKPDDFEKMLKEIFGNKTFADCKIPFVCTAVDLESGKLVTLNSGLLRDAVRASSSLPFILPPVFLNEKLLIDGGMIDDLPLPELRDLGPDVVMGVTVHSLQPKQKISADIYRKYYNPKKRHFFDFSFNFKEKAEFMIDIMARTLEIAMVGAAKTRIHEAKPDLMIEPNVPFGVIEIEKASKAIAIGRKAMRDNLPELKRLLS